MSFATRRTFLLALLFVAALVAVFVAAIAAGDARDAAPPPRAHGGVIDLRTHDFARQALVNLDGEWTIYWRQLLDPQAFAATSPPVADGLLTLPGHWQGQRYSGETAGAAGYATLRLSVLLPESTTPLALHLVGFYAANRIWVNGRPAAAAGRVAPDTENETAEQSLQIVELPDGARQIDIVIEASSFHLQSGATTHIALGAQSEIERRQVGKWSLAMLSVGTLLLMSFYHLALYFVRKSERSALYLGLGCLFWVGNIVSIESSNWVIRVFIPEAPGEILMRTWPLCLFIASALAYQFYRALYPQEFPRWIALLIWVVSLLYTALAIAAPLPLLVRLLPGYYALSFARMSFSAWALLLASRRRRPGARIILAGYLLMLLLSFNDMLNAMGVIRTVFVMHLGMIVYMFSQSLALALRFAALHASVENLSTALENRNRTLADEVAERTRLQNEIVSVSEEERRRMSHALHDGLCQQLTGARLQCAGLAAIGNGDAAAAPELARLSMLLEQSVDHAYDLAHGLWPLDPDADDAVAALAALVQRQRESCAIAIELQTRGNCAHCRTRHAAQLCGIAREAVGNAIKHSGAARITVTLDCTDARSVTLSVTDDGHARPATKPAKGGLGMRIMAYRAQLAGGDLCLETTGAGGTRVRCALPCRPVSEAPGTQ